MNGYRRVSFASMFLVALTLPLVLAGCGSDEARGDEGRVSVGISNLADLAPIYLGQKQGFFAEVGLDLDIQPQSGGSVTIAGVTSGALDLGYSNPVSLFVAQGQGLDFRILAPAATFAETADEDNSGIMVHADSGIEGPGDLAGATIGAASIKSQGTLATKLSLVEHGVDPESVQFVEIPRDGAVQAVLSAQVDAITDVEPAVSLAEKSGLVKIMGQGDWAVGTPGAVTGVYFTTAEFAEDNKETVERFQAAILKSLEYAAGHGDEVRQVLVDELSLEPAVAESSILPHWEQRLSKPYLEQLSEAVQEYGVSDRMTDIEPLLEHVPDSMLVG